MKTNQKQSGVTFGGALSVIVIVILLGLALALFALCTVAQGGELKKKPKKRNRPTVNYILRRQEAYEIRGTPVRTIYTHGRRIDIYRNGAAFEGDDRVN